MVVLVARNFDWIRCVPWWCGTCSELVGSAACVSAVLSSQLVSCG